MIYQINEFYFATFFADLFYSIFGSITLNPLMFNQDPLAPRHHQSIFYHGAQCASQMFNRTLTPKKHRGVKTLGTLETVDHGDNIFVKISIPTVCLTHRGDNPLT